MAERFLEREAHDIARVESVVTLAEHDGCLTQHLLEYFGESALRLRSLQPLRRRARRDNSLLAIANPTSSWMPP